MTTVRRLSIACITRLINLKVKVTPKGLHINVGHTLLVFLHTRSFETTVECGCIRAQWIYMYSCF